MDALYFYQMGAKYFALGEVEQAIQMLLKSAGMQESYRTYEMLYSCFAVRKDYQQAAEYIFRAFQLNHASDKSARRYAECLLQLGQKAEAKEILISIVQRNPGYLPAWRLLDLLCPSA